MKVSLRFSEGLSPLASPSSKSAARSIRPPAAFSAPRSLMTGGEERDDKASADTAVSKPLPVPTDQPIASKPQEQAKEYDKPPALEPGASSVETSRTILGDNPTPVGDGMEASLGVSHQAGSSRIGSSRRPGNSLSKDPELIRDSFVRPSYTRDAAQAGIEGEFRLDVLVGADGRVIDARLRRRIGFGMDVRIEAAMRQAIFRPAYNAAGQTTEQWTYVTIRLSLLDSER